MSEKRIRGLRKKDFKLGVVHGTSSAQDKASEAHIQRTIFLSQRLKIWHTLKKAPIIRIFGYEVPIEDYKRGRCADLMAYDAYHNLYIIELKKAGATDSTNKVAGQINDYAQMVKQILPYIEDEFEKAFFFPIRFKSIQKMVIAPRQFYKKWSSNDLKENRDILFGYYRDKDITKIKPKEVVSIHLRNI